MRFLLCIMLSGCISIGNPVMTESGLVQHASEVAQCVKKIKTERRLKKLVQVPETSLYEQCNQHVSASTVLKYNLISGLIIGLFTIFVIAAKDSGDEQPQDRGY